MSKNMSRLPSSHAIESSQLQSFPARDEPGCEISILERNESWITKT